MASAARKKALGLPALFVKQTFLQCCVSILNVSSTPRIASSKARQQVLQCNGCTEAVHQGFPAGKAFKAALLRKRHGALAVGPVAAFSCTFPRILCCFYLFRQSGTDHAFCYYRKIFVSIFQERRACIHATRWIALSLCFWLGMGMGMGMGMAAQRSRPVPSPLRAFPWPQAPCWSPPRP